MFDLRRALAALVLAACSFMPATASAAESFDSCKGYIDSLPATITTQGTWCLRQDLSTSINTGNAITVATNNVTIDCNDYKLGGLAAGLGTNAVGIGSMQRNNITVRNCNVRGFWIGINLAYNAGDTVPTTGDVVENNRIDGSTRIGISVDADGATIRGNTVVDTGGNTGAENAIAIHTHFGTDVIDNLIDGVAPTGESIAQSYGIIAWDNVGGVIANNRIRNVIANSFATGIALTSTSTGVTIKDNAIHMPGAAASIDCSESDPTNIARDNTFTGPTATLGSNCRDGGGNVGPTP